MVALSDPNHSMNVIDPVSSDPKSRRRFHTRHGLPTCPVASMTVTNHELQTTRRVIRRFPWEILSQDLRVNGKIRLGAAEVKSGAYENLNVGPTYRVSVSEPCTRAVPVIPMCH